MQIISDEVHIPEVCQTNLHKLEKQVAEMGKLKKMNHELKKDNNKLKSKNSKLKKEIEKEKERSKNFEDLNLKIQQTIIDKFEEKNGKIIF